MPHRFTALLFDFDGLIADTESAIYEAWRELYASEGQDLALADYVQCVGSTFGQYDPIAELERRLGREPDWPALLARKDARIAELHQGLGVMPGVRELLAEAAREGVPCAVASSSQMTWVGTWLKTFGLRAAFDAVVTRDFVERPKPAPDLFLKAAEALGRDPAACVVLEDSHNGLLAAKAAGCHCVVVPSPVTSVSDFSLADRVLPSLAGVALADLLA